MPANTIVVARPIHSIEDLGAGIIDAVYASDDPTCTSTSSPHNHSADPDERPIPRNLDALADLLRETQANRLVVSDWQVPENLADRILRVLELEGVQLALAER